MAPEEACHCSPVGPCDMPLTLPSHDVGCSGSLLQWPFACIAPKFCSVEIALALCPCHW